MEAFTGTILIVGFPFAPQDWAQCQGQLLAVNQNQALFSLFSTLYGGTGTTTFGLPDLRGRTPFGAGAGPNIPAYNVGNQVGAAQTTLSLNNLPAHTHAAAFTPTTGSQNVTIPAQTSSLKVAINVASTAAGNAGPSNTAIPAASAGANTKIYTSTTTSPAPTTTALADTATAVTGNAATAEQTVAVPTVTGGTVAISAGGGVSTPTPVSSMQPSLALNFIVALYGLYPTRS